MKVLVLTSRTGGGHDARAQAFREWINLLHGGAVEVRIDHTLENSSPWGAFGVAGYNAIQRRAPRFHHVYYNMGEVFGAFQRGKVQLGSTYYDALLREYQPDVILSVHSILNRGYFQYAKSRLAKPVHCVTYCGEFSGGYGFSRNWVSLDADLFLGRSEATLKAAEQLGVPSDKVRSLGHMLKPAFHQPAMSPAERTEYLRESLELDPDRFTILLATGGAAAQNHLVFLRKLLPFAGRLQVIALCGRSAPARKRLEAWRGRHPEFGLAILPFSGQMHRLLQVASAVVTRPGTGTSSEAVQLGCPIVFNRIGGTMPQEYCTLRHFEALDLALGITSPAGFQRIVGRWLDQPLEYHRYLQRFRAAKTHDDPEALIRAILGQSAPDASATVGRADSLEATRPRVQGTIEP